MWLHPRFFFVPAKYNIEKAYEVQLKWHSLSHGEEVSPWVQDTVKCN